MMLKIDRIETTGERCVLRLEGRVIGPWVAELRRCCEQALATSPTLTLDLASVAFVDRAGVDLFRALRRRDVVMANCSGFVAAQLDA